MDEFSASSSPPTPADDEDDHADDLNDDDGENVDEVLDSFARSHWEWEDKQTAPSAFIVHSLLPIMTR